ncbi:MFS transporter [Salinigranum rubrum]|uniref:MFS transporter n=1 Tax=Salinigranum rubrum TaxID=755307 RepID=UPI0013A57E78|nr:MFS transporter [Salinigranum rubrum]
MFASRLSERGTWLVVICWFVAVDAVGLQLRGPLLASLEAEFGASPALLGLVAPAGTVGFVATLLVMGSVAGRLDIGRAMRVGVVAVAVCVALLAFVPSFTLYLGVLVLRGVATGVFRALDRPVLSHLYADARGRVFNLYDFAWAVGATLGPVLVVAALAAGSWRLAYGVLAVGFVPVAVALWRLDFPELSGVERPLRLADVRRVLGRTEVTGASVALFVSGGVEGGLFTWLPYYARTVLPSSTASLTLSVLVLGYIPGRLVYSRVAERVGYLPLVLALTAGGTVVLVGVLTLAGTPLLVAVFVLGVLLSGVSPTLTAYAMSAVPSYGGPANAVTTGSVYFGLAVFPPVMGVMLERRGIEAAISLLPVLATLTGVCLVVTFVAVRRRGRVAPI